MNEGSTAPAVSYAGPSILGPQGTGYGLREVGWVRLGVIAVLMVGVFWPALRRLCLLTVPFLGDTNWQHSFFVPAIGLYYLYLNREALLKAEVRPMLWGRLLRLTRVGVAGGMTCAGAVGWWLSGENAYILTVAQAMVFYGALVVVFDWGLGTTLFGLFTYAYGINPGQNDFVQHSAIVATVFGVTLLVCGWEIMKVAWFPIVFLVCAIPWPPLVYSWVALPLQELAASVAAGTLRVTGVEAFRSGTKLFIGDGANQRVLNVAEACAGLKSLMTFVTLAGAMGFLSSRPMWQKILITVSAVPIAILCNVFRVSGQGLLDHYVSPKWSENFAHQFAGVIMLIPAFFLLQATGWILDNVFIEEVDKRAIGERLARKGEELVIEIPRSAGREAAASSAQAGVERTNELAAATQRLMATVGGGRRGKAERVSGAEKAEGR